MNNYREHFENAAGDSSDQQTTQEPSRMLAHEAERHAQNQSIPFRARLLLIVDEDWW